MQILAEDDDNEDRMLLKLKLKQERKVYKGLKREKKSLN